MRKRLTAAGGLLTAIIGIGGLNDDLATWYEWAKTDRISPDIGWWLLVGAGFVLLLFNLVSENQRNRFWARMPGLITRRVPHPSFQQHTSDVKRDALNHFQIESTRTRLHVNEGLAGKPVMYPLSLRTTRPLPVDIVGYDVTVLWDNNPVSTVSWYPPSATTSSGFRVAHPYPATSPQDLIRIKGDTRITFDIPVNLRQIGTLPTLSPRWGMKGYLSLICGGEPSKPRAMTFDVSRDQYQVDDEVWMRLRSEIMIG